MDVLSEVLDAMRLTGAVFLDMELHADWSYLTAPARAIADVLMPEADHVIPYHFVAEGSCHARLLDGEPVELQAGDVIMFPAGDRHVLTAASSTALQRHPSEITGESLVGLLKRGELVPFRKGRAGKTTRITCGYLACDRRLAEPILRTLPRLLKINVRGRGASAWIRSAFRYSVAETRSARPGASLVMARLSEILFAEAIRRHVEIAPGDRGWLAALRDRHIGRTLSLLHAQPAHPWTVEELAAKVGLSRSALAQRFNTLLGVPPMQYLTRWRISLAAKRLREGPASILLVATEVGYESEGAFNRAFKRELGLPPAAWRKSIARQP